MQTFEIISRDEAAKQQKVRYFTGIPCKNGHIAQRYVLNAGCLDCAQRFKRVRAQNPFSHDLVPYDTVRLWRSKRHTQETLDGLSKYIQECIKKFEDHTLGPICDLCTGSQRIPKKEGMDINWYACPRCLPQPSVDAQGFAPGSEAPPLR